MNAIHISKLRSDHREIFERLNKEPVLLVNQAQPEAVLVSMKEWNGMIKELSRLRGTIDGDRILPDRRSFKGMTLDNLEAIPSKLPDVSDIDMDAEWFTREQVDRLMQAEGFVWHSGE